MDEYREELNNKNGGSKKAVDFSRGSVAGLVVKQALPLSVSMLAQLLYNIVDRIFIGHIPGEGLTPLTGLGLTLPIITIISAFTLLFGQGGAPLFSIARGQKKEERASVIMGNSFSLLLIGAFVLTITCFLLMKPILYAFGASDHSYVYAAKYLRIYLWGTPLTMIATGLNYYITSQGFPKTAMVTVMSGAVINIGLDPVFIYAFGMGIEGAAVATIISQTISFLWVMRFLCFKAPIRLTRGHMTLRRDIASKIVTMGLTGFVMEINNSLVQVVCNRTLRRYGGDMGDLYITVMTIVNSVRAIMGVAVNGITSGAQPVLGFNYGAKRYDRVKQGIKVTGLMSFSYTALAWLIIFLFPGFFIGLFSSDAKANLIAVPYLHIFFMAYVFMALQFSGQSTFMALGKAPQAIFFSIFRKVILVVPLTLLLPLYLKDPISGVFWAEPISNIIGGSASFITMYFTVYRRLGRKKNEDM